MRSRRYPILIISEIEAVTLRSRDLVGLPTYTWLTRDGWRFWPRPRHDVVVVLDDGVPMWFTLKDDVKPPIAEAAVMDALEGPFGRMML
jgi:hypothetical protein